MFSYLLQRLSLLNEQFNLVVHIQEKDSKHNIKVQFLVIKADWKKVTKIVETGNFQWCQKIYVEIDFYG